MSSGSNVTLNLSKVTIDSVEIIATNQFASETGPVVVFDSDNTEVTRSSNITVSQNNVPVTISGLDSYTEYTAKFYNNDSAMFSDSVVTFTTLGTNKIYGGVSGAGPVTGVSGTIRAGAKNVTAFDADTFWSVAEADIDKTKTMSYLTVYVTDKGGPLAGRLLLYYTDGTNTELVASYTSVPDFGAYGIAVPSTPVVAQDYIDLTEIYEAGAKQITDLYGGSNSGAQRITKLYGATGSAITGVTGTIRAGGAGNVTGFDNVVFFNAVKEDIDQSKTLSYARAQSNASGTKAVLFLGYTDNTEQQVASPTFSGLASYGITGVATADGSDYIDLTPIMSPTTKLIHQGFGHIDYGYGVVTYYTDANRVATDVVYLSSQSEVTQLSRGNGSNPQQSWSAVIGDVTIPNDRIKEVMLTEKVTTLNGSLSYRCFLANCAYVTKIDLSKTKLTAVADEGYFCWRNSRLKQLYLPDTVTTIGEGFCISAGTYTATAFSPSLVLPSRLVTIGDYFLGGAETFNQDLLLPQTLTSIGAGFLGNMRYMTGTVNVGSLSADVITTDEKSFCSTNSGSPAYSTGISIAGSSRAAWLAKFPNSSSSPYYRKLIDAGY